MASTLEDRSDLKRALYRLLDTSASDPGLTEHDPTDEDLEAVHQAVNEGLWDAQSWLIQKGLASRWTSTADWPSGSPDSSWQGTENEDGGRWAALPTDFLRLAGDQERSAFRKPKGTRWGRLVEHDERFTRRGNVYWLENENLWIARGANPPSDLMLDYHFRHATLTADDDALDFPLRDRKLIVAYAGLELYEEAWPVEDEDMERKIRSKLRRRQQKSRMRARRSRDSRHVDHARTHGNHWFV